MWPARPYRGASPLLQNLVGMVLPANGLRQATMNLCSDPAVAARGSQRIVTYETGSRVAALLFASIANAHRGRPGRAGTIAVEHR